MGKAKKTLRYILLATISLLLLTSMLLSTMLGSVNAKMFRSIKKNLSLEAIPDLPLRYYLKDKDATPESGVYKNLKSINQAMQITDETGYNVLYHIEIPVSEAGYYTLNFEVDISSSTSGTSFSGDLNNPVGCKVISVNSSYYYGSTTAFRLSSETRIANVDTPNSGGLGETASEKYMFQKNPYFSASDNYQWRTVAPSRMESVALTFYVNGDDVANGKVLWIWDFHGLKNPSAPNAVTYNIKLTNVAWEKDYSSATRNEPYFDFANMTYKNMNIIPTYNSSAKIQKNTAPTGTKPTRYNTTVQGHNTAGLTRETGGRGTYVTNATTNSLLMQVEPVYYGWRFSNIASKDGNKDITLYADQPWIGSEDEGIQNKYGTANLDYSNPIVFNVPVKNVQPGKTYKVVFDF